MNRYLTEQIIGCPWQEQVNFEKLKNVVGLGENDSNQSIRGHTHTPLNTRVTIPISLVPLNTNRMLPITTRFIVCQINYSYHVTSFFGQHIFSVILSIHYHVFSFEIILIPLSNTLISPTKTIIFFSSTLHMYPLICFHSVHPLVYFRFGYFNFSFIKCNRFHFFPYHFFLLYPCKFLF